MVSSILEGIRVIDWGSWIVGPEAAALLADMGAEVVHVEQTGTGDPLRHFHRMLGVPQMLQGGRQITFEYVNRNKKGIAIDLTKDEGKDIMLRLVRKADVFISNFRYEAAVKFGLDYDTLRKHNDQLIYASASSFGSRGPDAKTPGFDLVASARSGIMQLGSEGDTPAWPPFGMADYTGGFVLAFGVLAALIAKQRFGIVQELHVSQLGSLLKLLSHVTYEWWINRKPMAWPKRTEVNNPMYNMYKCKDGRWIVLGLLAESDWPRLCNALKKPSLGTDERFKTAADREKRSKELIVILDEIFGTKTREEWSQILRDGDIVFSFVNNIKDLEKDPQVIENQYMIEYDHPVLGRVKLPGFPVEFRNTPMTLRMPAPEYSEHTEDILVNLCGYSWEDIIELKDRGVIP